MPAEHPLLAKLARSLVLSEAEAVRAIPVQSVLFKAHQNISREGERPSRSSFVSVGVACTSKVVAGGKRQIMALHMAGDMPDLHSMHLKLLDSDIWAISECRVTFFAHADLRALSRQHPRLGEDLWRTALVDGSIYREWMVNVGQRQADSRMAHLICKMLLRSEEAGLGQDGTCPLPVIQADPSEMTAMLQVLVNRTLQALRAQGLISFGKGVLTIHNWPALVALADIRADYLHLPTAQAA